MRINQFLRLLRQAREEHGYWFELQERLRIVPDDSNSLFATVRTFSIVHCDPDADPRPFQPITVVWHCFYRKRGEPQLVELSRVMAILKLSYRRTTLILGAGDEWHGYDRRLRNLLLDATGLEEVPMSARGPVVADVPKPPPHGSRAPRRQTPRPAKSQALPNQ